MYAYPSCGGFYIFCLKIILRMRYPVEHPINVIKFATPQTNAHWYIPRTQARYRPQAQKLM